MPPAPAMLTLEEEDLGEELRRELIVLLHVTRGEYGGLREGELERALAALSEVRGRVVRVSLRAAALTIAIPPFLPSDRLREVLLGCLEKVFHREISLSLRLPAELADTVEVGRELAREWERSAAVLCLADERAVGDLDRPLVDLKAVLERRVEAPVAAAFPVTFVDVLCRWEETMDGVVWGPEAVVAGAYMELTRREVSVTARSLEVLADVMGGAESRE